MFGLSYLFYPWGIILQVIAMVHFVRRRPENYWFFIILFGGLIGASAYIVIEIVPDAGLLRNTFRGFGRRSRIQSLETQILDNPSPGNYEELGELYLEEKKFAKARESFTTAINARDDSPYAFYHRAEASLELNDLAAAIPDLERVVAGDRKFDYHRAAGLLGNAYARSGDLDRAAVFYAEVTQGDRKFDYHRAAGLLGNAYARSGDLDRAAVFYAEVTQFSTTPESLYNYAYFLKLRGQTAEAREWTQKLLAKKRTLPRYMQRIERPWFRKGKALLRELKTP